VRREADIVIIGAGIMGLSAAYHLARLAPRQRISVLDASYLCGGASGRNGGGVRAQWSSEPLIRLMQESLELCREFAREHRINTWFRQGGYLFLARNAEQRTKLEQSVQLQNQCGLSTRLLEPRRIRETVPELSTEGVAVASYNPDDAVVFPWPFVWGYAEGARALGVEVNTFTRVVGFETRGRSITRVETDRGSIATSVVINATGAHAPEVARLLGVELPNRPHRHEICSSEPLKPWLTPLVADLDDGLYFSQSTRGEIVGGIGDAKAPEGADQQSSYRFLALYSRALLRACPILGSVKILRQWAGLYDRTPDNNPIVGPVDEIDGFFQVSGFVGHGFMMAPVIGKRLAEWVASGRAPAELERWNLRRFREGHLLSEGMIIG
jgi:sarcosine oxidase, subunit beta